MFGIDDAIMVPALSAIGIGGMNLFGNMQRNEASLEQTMMTNVQNQQLAAAQNVWSAQQAEIARNFNAEQAQLGRNFAIGSMREAEAFNASEAGKQRDFEAVEADLSRLYNAEQAQRARDFEERMSSTAYQRATGDMKAAGINPMVAYMQGGASTPSSPMGMSSPPGGSSASISPASAGIASGSGAQGFLAHMSPASVQNIMDNVTSSAMEAAKLGPTYKRLVAEAENAEVSTGLLTEQKALTNQKYNTELQETARRAQELETERQETRKRSAEADISTSRVPRETVEGDIYSSKAGQFAAWSRALSTGVQPWVSTAKDVATMRRGARGWDFEDRWWSGSEGR